MRKQRSHHWLCGSCDPGWVGCSIQAACKSAQPRSAVLLKYLPNQIFRWLQTGIDFAEFMIQVKA